MINHRFASNPKAMLSAFLALSVLYLACSVPAQAQQKVQEYADGWQLVNPPSPVHIHDSFAPYFTIDIDTQPINPNLPQNMHPMAHILNRYEILQFHPNPEKILWNDNIRIDYATKTRNIVTEFAPALADMPKSMSALSNNEKKALPAVSRSKPKFSLVHFIFNTIAVLAVLPIAVIALVLCSPIIVASAGKSAHSAIKNKRQNHQLLEIFKHVLVFKQSVDDLQQEFNEKFEDPEHPTSGKPLLNSYNILPSRSDYSLDLPKKSLTYFAQVKMVDLKFQFKPPYPTRSSLQQAYIESTFKGTLRFDSSSQSDKSDSLKEDVQYIKACTLTYSKGYHSKDMMCTGMRKPEPASDE
jgi:hypothetical protein